MGTGHRPAHPRRLRLHADRQRHARLQRSAHARKGLGRRWLWSAMCTRVGRGSRHGGRRATPTYLCATSICPARGRLVAAARCSLLLRDVVSLFFQNYYGNQTVASRRSPPAGRVCRLRHNVPALRARVRVRCLSIRVRVCEPMTRPLDATVDEILAPEAEPSRLLS